MAIAKTQITKNSDNISQNSEDIIVANTKISKNTDDILKYGQSLSNANDQITQNSNSISKNAEGLVSANVAITENAKGLIVANTAITENAEGLVAANTAITENVNNLKTANVAISENTKGLVAANTAITENTKGLVTANTAIAKNTSDLINTDANVANLGSAVQQNTTKIAQGVTFSDGKSSNTYQLGDTVAVKSTNQNLSVQTTEDGISVGLSNDIQLNSIRVNNGPSMSSNGINAANHRIANVSPGINYNDAVNVGQLSKVYEYSRQGDEIAYKGIAMSAALSNGSDAVARPGQLSGMVGVGSFKGNTAMALGM